MKYLLDTNSVSELVKPRPNASFEKWVAETDEESLYLSVITLGELRRGIERLAAGTRRRQLENWFNTQLLPRFEGRILVVTQEIGEKWGSLLGQSEARGRRIGIVDGLIAATTSVYGMTLVTRNVMDFGEAGIAMLSPWE